MAATLLCGLSGPGCYYAHLGAGQARLLLARHSTAELRADPETPDHLRAQLQLVDQARHFAADLGLEAGERYTSYVDWPGDRIVTTVVATRPGEVEALDFDFPIVGAVPYKGFFELSQAEDEARSLRARGLDVCLVPVTAYSTLGWMDDPLTAPMLRRSDDTRLVETVLHELVHATVFVESQPEFNEGVARFIGQEAALRFFAADPDRERTSQARVRDDRRVAAALLRFRDRVAALYEREPDPVLQARSRAALEEGFRMEMRSASLETRDPVQLAERLRLNDACLAIGGTYAADAPRHERVLQGLGGDLRRFIARLREAAHHDDPRAWFFVDVEGLEAAR